MRSCGKKCLCWSVTLFSKRKNVPAETIPASDEDERGHDTQDNDTQHSDIEHNDTQHMGLICDTQHK